MTWISLVCFLALTSSAFGRSAYGSGYGGSSYGSAEKVIPLRPTFPTLPTLPAAGYGSQFLPEKTMNKIVTGYGGQISLPKLEISQGYGSAAPRLPEVFPIEQGYGSSKVRVAPVFVPPMEILTEADILCKGKQPETVIPLDGGRRFVVCVDEAKGHELQCPKGLFYHPDTRRCERKLGPLENLCVSQPCLNGGQCIPEASSYRCQCSPGYDGRTCELDSRVCETQQPCGQAPGTRCQSYRANAALSYVCIFQDGEAYGFSAQQVQRNPCQGVDGPRSLVITDKGFIMCDGDRMFIDACPGGTIWDDLNKACSWPDLQGVIAPADEITSYGKTSSYGSEARPAPIKETFTPMSIPQPRPVESYGQVNIPRPPMNPFPAPPTSYGQTFVPETKPVESYGQVNIPRPPMNPFPAPTASYGQITAPLPKIVLPTPKIFTQPSSGYGSQTPKAFIPEASGY